MFFFDKKIRLSIFLIEEANRVDMKWRMMGYDSLLNLFMLYKLDSTQDERIGSNTVIRGARAWHHLPAVNPITPLSCEHTSVWFLPHRGKTFNPLSTCF
jgi:hypothetical protein